MKTPLYTSVLLKREGGTLTVYQGKKNKNVLLYSTMHTDVEIQNNSKHLPETVSFYNSTKFAVDVLDQMTRKYSVRSCTRRWPVHVFHNILDLAAINAWIIFKLVTGIKISRRNFILNLAEELRRAYMETRNQERMPREGKEKEDGDEEREEAEIPAKVRKLCQTRKCRNKTNEVCSKCKRYVCGPCTYKVIKTVVCNACK